MIRKNPNYSSRQYVVIGIFSIITTILLARLFYIQIISQDYKKDNTVRHITLYPSRGRIIDRNGKVLVYNDAIYDLMVVPRAVKKSTPFLFVTYSISTRIHISMSLKKQDVIPLSSLLFSYRN